MDCESHDRSLYADARRALLRTMREVRSVSERIGALVAPCTALQASIEGSRSTGGREALARGHPRSGAE